MAPGPEAHRLTVVILQYRKNRLNHRLVFGTARFIVRRGWRRRLAAFAPDATFGYERWQAGDHGTRDWRLFVCRTSSQGSLTKIPGVLPGAVLLFEARGKTKVKRAFVALDAIRREGESLEDLAPHRWRALHNALQTRPSTLNDGSDPSWPRV